MDKIISFTFDDGHFSHFTRVLPLFDNYKIQGTHYIIVGNIDRIDILPKDRHLNWEEILKLQNYGWEMSSHTMTHSKLNLLSIEEVEFELKESKKILLEHNIKSFGFSYPFGIAWQSFQDRVKLYYKYGRSTNDIGMSFIDNLYNLPSISLETYSIENIIEYINKGIFNLLIFRCHRTDGYLEEKIKQIIELAIQKNIKILSLDKALIKQGFIKET